MVFKSSGLRSLRLLCCLPALFGDDHLGLVPVEFQPQRPVAQIDLRSGSGGGPRQRHGADTRPRTGIRRVQTARALAELVPSAAKLAPAGAHGRGGEARWRQDGSVMKGSRVPGAAGPGVHRPGLSCVGKEGTGTCHVGTRLGRRDEVSVRAKFVYVVTPTARQLVLAEHRGAFPPIGPGFSESVPLSLAQHPAAHPAQIFLRSAARLGFRPVDFLVLELRRRPRAVVGTVRRGKVEKGLG